MEHKIEINLPWWAVLLMLAGTFALGYVTG